MTHCHMSYSCSSRIRSSSLASWPSVTCPRIPAPPSPLPPKSSRLNSRSTADPHQDNHPRGKRHSVADVAWTQGNSTPSRSRPSKPSLGLLGLGGGLGFFSLALFLSAALVLRLAFFLVSPAFFLPPLLARPAPLTVAVSSESRLFANTVLTPVSAYPSEWATLNQDLAVHSTV